MAAGYMNRTSPKLSFCLAASELKLGSGPTNVLGAKPEGEYTAASRVSEFPSYIHRGHTKDPRALALMAQTPAPHTGHLWLPVCLASGRTCGGSPAATLAFDAFGPALMYQVFGTHPSAN